MLNIYSLALMLKIGGSYESMVTGSYKHWTRSHAGDSVFFNLIAIANINISHVY